MRSDEQLFAALVLEDQCRGRALFSTQVRILRNPYDLRFTATLASPREGSPGEWRHSDPLAEGSAISNRTMS